MRRLVLTIVLLACAVAPAAPADRWAWAGPKFSPNGGCTDQLVKAVGQAKKSVRVLAYSFTSERIVAALIDAHRRGVDVQIVLDKSDVGAPKSGLPACKAAGIPVRIDRKHAIAHNKVLIIDGEVVFTGSFNFTESAEKHNAENSVPVLDPAWVRLYEADWAKHWGHAEKP